MFPHLWAKQTWKHSFVATIRKIVKAEPLSLSLSKLFPQTCRQASETTSEQQHAGRFGSLLFLRLRRCCRSAELNDDVTKRRIHGDAWDDESERSRSHQKWIVWTIAIDAAVGIGVSTTARAAVAGSLGAAGRANVEAARPDRAHAD